MLKRDVLISNYFRDLNILTKEDKIKIQSIFARRTKLKVESSNLYVRQVIYSKAVRNVDKEHKFFKEYKKLEIGQLNWFDSLSKSFKSYIGWYLQNQYIFEIKDVKKDVRDIVYEAITLKCFNEVVSKFYDQYLDDETLNVKGDVLDDYYYRQKLDLPYHEKMFKLYQYIIEDDKEDMLNLDGSIKSEYLMDYCILDESIPCSIDEKIRVSVGRTREMFDWYAKANAEKFKYFVTLTFAKKEEQEKHLSLNENREPGDHDLKFIYIDDLTSFESCNKSLNVFFTALKRDLKKELIELYYLGCPEYQENGNIHYHFLFSDIPDDFIYKIPKWLDYDFITKKFNNGHGLKNWRYGKSDIQEIEDQYKVTTYISKYIIKSLDALDGTCYFERLNKKRYFASQNLVKPEVKYDALVSSELDYKSVYVSERKSSFNENEIVDILYSI